MKKNINFSQRQTAMSNTSTVKMGPGRIRSLSKGDKKELFETIGGSFSDSKNFRQTLNGSF